MRKPRIHLRKALVGALAAILVIGAVAPLVNANRYRGQIRSALEAALKRRVSIDQVHLNLFTGPGFTLDGVTIGDRPQYGIEPFAHVESLKARIKLASLWTGRLAFSHLKLSEPTVNFVKLDAGPWNVQPVLSAAAQPARGATLPDIEITSGRLNFKFGTVKSVFYLNNADLEIYPNDNGALVIRFSGLPLRTDHTAQDLGRLVARGVLQPGGQLDMSVQLERTAISELARLLNVEDGAIQGYLATNIKLSGPLHRIGISGELRISDLHRWDLLPNSSAAWSLNYTGSLDLAAQRFQIETRSNQGLPGPVTGRLAAWDYLTSPHWEASLSFAGVPASGLLETARHIGVPIPAQTALDGHLSGDVWFSQGTGVHGELAIDDAAVRFPNGGEADFDHAALGIEGGNLRFGPAQLSFPQERRGAGGDATAGVSAFYSLETRSLALDLSTERLPIQQIKMLAGDLGSSPFPLLAACENGFWSGVLGFRRENKQPDSWSGQLEIEGTQAALPGLAAPLHLSSAAVRMDAMGVEVNRIRGRIGEIAFDGDYRFPADHNLRDRFHLNAASVDLLELERVLLPTLRRRQGFLERALRLQPSSAPDWLANRDAAGSIRIKRLKAGPVELGALRTQVIWDGASVQLPDLEMGLSDMPVTGVLFADLSGAVPHYSFNGQVRNAAYANGKLDLDGKLTASGTGLSLLASMKSEGTFSGAGLQLSPDLEADEVSGDYRLSMTSNGPRLMFPSIELTRGQDVLRGQGASDADGRIVLDVVSAGKQVRLTGALWPPRVAPAQ